MKESDKQKIADELVGTSGVYDSSIAERFGIEVDQLEEIAGECEVVRCACCGWWCEQSEMEEVDGEEVCEDCR